MLLFFNRPEVLKKTWKWFEEVKPRRLFHVQDGARADRVDDIENIELCREIVSDITWTCDVKTNYAETNMGCDYREYTGIDWCFQYVDRLIIIEDDCRPAASFYRFCGELPEKNCDDNRIYMISDFNRQCVYMDTPNDYVFSMSCAGWSWATWKRTWMQVKAIEQWPFLRDLEERGYYTRLLDGFDYQAYSGVAARLENNKLNDENTGHVTSWEALVGGAQAMNSSLAITPQKNMIKYYGSSENAAHSDSSPELIVKK